MKLRPTNEPGRCTSASAARGRATIVGPLLFRRVPKRHVPCGPLRERMELMAVAESFVSAQRYKTIHMTATRAGIRIKVKRVPAQPGHLRIERIA